MSASNDIRREAYTYDGEPSEPISFGTPFRSFFNGAVLGLALWGFAAILIGSLFSGALWIGHDASRQIAERHQESFHAGVRGNAGRASLTLAEVE